MLAGLALGGAPLAAAADGAAKRPSAAQSPGGVATQVATQMVVRVTGYCSCGKCCGWRRSWFGLGPPVFASGPLKGRRKQVGVTARGTLARDGTVAADPKVLPFGTRLKIPDYGVGVVEDTGGSVTGRHVDVWFSTHEAARRWGSRTLTVDVLPR